MRVLMLSHMYPSAVNPTAGIFVHEQVRALRALGHDVRVVSPKGWAPPGLARWAAYRRVPGVDRVDGVPVLYPRKLTLPGGALGRRNTEAMRLAIRGPLARIRRRWPYDVVHAHMLVPDGWTAARIAPALGAPVVATAHRADVLDLPARSAAWRSLVAEAVCEIDQIATVSAAIREACERLGAPRRPIEVVPNGADARVFAPRAADVARARLGLPADERIVTYVGKLVPRKGVDTLVEAMGVLGSRPGGAPLLVAAGIGELRGELEARAGALGVAERVRFVGKVPHDDVAWWMAAGDVFVLPSLSEGLPTVVCEAMAAGRPVVATAVDGTPEVVEEGRTGFLVAPRDPAALADRLSRVLDDPALARAMGARAHERAMADYTWEANARHMAAIYAAVAGAR
jgi:glycosyltransferase involved in cell wall biosynthesis